MASEHFVKVYGTILDSSIWYEKDATRILWITMLAMADSTGYIEAATPGLAGRARISLEDCEESLTLFQSPDKHSKNQEYEGRRVEKVDRGWQLLNYQDYRDMRTEAQVKRAERQARWRAGVIERERLRVAAVGGGVDGVDGEGRLHNAQRGEGRGERGDTTSTTTTARAREELGQQLTVEGQNALDGLIKANAQPEALVGECTMILAGERQIKPKPTPEGLSLALCDLVTNGQRPTARSLRTYTADAMRQLTEGISTSRAGTTENAWDKAIVDAKKREEADANRK